MGTYYKVEILIFLLIGEFYILKVKPSTPVQMSVYLMILGSIVAASNDLAFNLRGYVYVLLNDFFTAGNGVLMKKKLESKDLGKYGVMYYNSLFMLTPAIVFAWQTGDLQRVSGSNNSKYLEKILKICSAEFEGWSDPMLCSQFLLSCVFGFILIYSTVLCTAYNSALTTTIIGCLKNILITYMGMFIGGDYQYSFINFLGLNISVIGSLVYTKGNENFTFSSLTLLLLFSVTFSSKSSSANNAPPPLPVTSVSVGK